MKKIMMATCLLFFIAQAYSQQKISPAESQKPLTAKMKAMYKSKLDPGTYSIMVEKGTELAYHNKYWNNHASGTYVSAATGEPLFSSDGKFDSHTGWPSFFKTINPSALAVVEDTSFGEVRKEVVERKTGLHLGHVFDDGPQPTGLRYCMNSAALKFIPAKSH